MLHIHLSQQETVVWCQLPFARAIRKVLPATVVQLICQRTVIAIIDQNSYIVAGMHCFSILILVVITVFAKEVR